MPELPQMRALAERLAERLDGEKLVAIDALSFSALKTATPPFQDLISHTVRSASSLGKFLRLDFSGAMSLLVHLGQSGRVVLEEPPQTSRPRDGVVRLTFGEIAVLVRELSREHRAGWWVLAPGDDGPVARLGPDPFSETFAELVRSTTARRQLHTWLRDQQVVAGIGRGYVDDILNGAHLSPFASAGKLDEDERERLLFNVVSVLSGALERERRRKGGLAETDLGERFLVHRRSGQPCPSCAATLERVSYSSCEVVYCPHCQCNDRVLADRRMSRLLR